MKRSLKLITAALTVTFILSGCGIKKTDDSAAKTSKVTEALQGSSSPEAKGNFLQELKDLKIYDRNNAESSLLEMSKGKATAIIFYTSWCPHCRKYIPLADEVFKKENGNINFVFVNIVDSGEKIRETRESGMKYHLESGYAFPYYSADTMISAETFGITKIPLILFYGNDGRLKGYLKEEFTKEDIENLLKK